MADGRPLPETLLDYLLYAPLGAALMAVEELPRLAERGRERFEKRVGLAGSIGRFAVQGAVRRLQPRPPVLLSQVERAEESASEPAAPKTGETLGPTCEPAATAPAVKPAGSARRLRSRPATVASQRSTDGSGEELPIPAYGTLAASQVVERLASLTPGELESVRRHESATRRRRTVLHRIAQLNAERGGATA